MQAEQTLERSSMFKPSFTQISSYECMLAHAFLCLESLIMLTSCQIHLRMQPRWRPFKLDRQGFFEDTEAVQLGQSWGEDALRDQRQDWWQFECLHVAERRYKKE